MTSLFFVFYEKHLHIVIIKYRKSVITMTIHTVKPGDTLASIARRYQTTTEQIIKDNDLQRPDTLVIGQDLVILIPEITYTVQENDTISSIAEKFQLSVKQLYRNNYFLHGRPNISPGDLLTIKFTDTPDRKITVNNYAYPYISEELLDSQLPYLSYLIPFTYGISQTGTLLDLNDENLIASAKQMQTKLLMHLSTLTENDNFSNERASIVLSDSTLQNNLINEILEKMRQKGYDGLDVDFEFIYPEEKYEYTAFLQNLRLQLNPLGYPLYSALAPKTSDTQQGILYEGHDYSTIGAAANFVLLMTYEWGYTYGPPMAVAPLNKVREVLLYALTRITKDKILLGIPTYGYDWKLPYIKGETVAESISPVEAVHRAQIYHAEIHFDPTAQSPWFKYTDSDGNLHEVWFENARSIRAKLNLVSEFDLKGVGYWNAMRDFPENWVVLNALYQIDDFPTI